MSIVVEIIERAKPALKRMELGLKNGTVGREIGRAVVKLVQDHFRALPPNKRKFPSTHFWQRAADATRFETNSEGVRVSVNQLGIRQRLLGGPIDPIRGKYLTIPAIAETYGHSAADFSDLKLWRVSSGGWSSVGLAPSNATPNSDGSIAPSSVYFWLLRHVNQMADPKVLPKDDEIRETSLAAAHNYLTRLQTGGGNN